MAGWTANPGRPSPIDELILRPWRPADAPDGARDLPGPGDRPLGDDPPAVHARRRGRLHRDRADDVARWHRRAVRHRRCRHRSAARSGDPVRARRGTRPRSACGSHPRRGVAASAPGPFARGGLDVRDHRGHPPGRVHHGRQRGVAPDGRAGRVPARGRRSAPGTCITTACPSIASSISRIRGDP